MLKWVVPRCVATARAAWRKLKPAGLVTEVEVTPSRFDPTSTCSLDGILLFVLSVERQKQK